MIFEKSKYIWIKKSKNEVNEYANFKSNFIIENKKDTKIRISSITDYVLFINNQLVGFNQYPNFVDEKYYDEYVLDKIVNEGDNELFIIALSKNYNTASHIKDGKGIIFEIISNNKIILCSNENILSSLNPNYKSGQIYYVTSQLGMGFDYDFKEKPCIYENSAVIEKNCHFVKRPIKKLDINNKISFIRNKNDIYDGQKELSGYLYFDIVANEDCDIEIYYGEHLTDKAIRYQIHNRQFKFIFHLKKGNNNFIGYFFRLGLRYLSTSKFNGTINDIGIYQALYPLQEISLNSPIPKEIVDKAIYTIKCCMHEHYEDCPWREQAQYTMDSRLQMLITYDIFNEYDFPRACLLMMNHKLTDKDVYPITSPCQTNLSIPIYSLIYPLLLKEYYERTKDIELLKIVYKNLSKMINHYINKLKNGLLCHLDEWNFYEWSDGLDYDNEISIQKQIDDQYDLPLNAFMIIALDNYSYVCKILDKPYLDYLNLANDIRKKAHNLFINKNDLFYSFIKNNNKYHLSEYSNLLAIYSKIANQKESNNIIEVIKKDNNGLVPLSLSSYIFKYEILLESKENIQYIIDDIKRIFGYMNEKGATTYWETTKGEADFEGAGSLCHGWSSVPAYVSYILNKKGKE